MHGQPALNLLLNGHRDAGKQGGKPLQLGEQVAQHVANAQHLATPGLHVQLLQGKREGRGAPPSTRHARPKHRQALLGNGRKIAACTGYSVWLGQRGAESMRKLHDIWQQG